MMWRLSHSRQLPLDSRPSKCLKFFAAARSIILMYFTLVAHGHLCLWAGGNNRRNWVVAALVLPVAADLPQTGFGDREATSADTCRQISSDRSMLPDVFFQSDGARAPASAHPVSIPPAVAPDDSSRIVVWEGKMKGRGTSHSSSSGAHLSPQLSQQQIASLENEDMQNSPEWYTADDTANDDDDDGLAADGNGKCVTRRHSKHSVVNRPHSKRQQTGRRRRRPPRRRSRQITRANRAARRQSTTANELPRTQKSGLLFMRRLVSGDIVPLKSRFTPAIAGISDDPVHKAAEQQTTAPRYLLVEKISGSGLFPPSMRATQLPAAGGALLEASRIKRLGAATPQPHDVIRTTGYLVKLSSGQPKPLQLVTEAVIGNDWIFQRSLIPSKLDFQRRPLLLPWPSEGRRASSALVTRAESSVPSRFVRSDHAEVYTAFARLARGAFGEVWRAISLDTKAEHAEVVLKRMLILNENQQMDGGKPHEEGGDCDGSVGAQTPSADGGEANEPQSGVPPHGSGSGSVWSTAADELSDGGGHHTSNLVRKGVGHEVPSKLLTTKTKWMASWMALKRGLSEGHRSGLREVYFGRLFKGVRRISRLVEYFEERHGVSSTQLLHERLKESAGQQPTDTPHGGQPDEKTSSSRRGAATSDMWLVFANEGYSLSNVLFQPESPTGGKISQSSFWRSLKAGRSGMLTLREIMRQILEGVSEAHKRRVVHRDIKLENIFIRLPRTPIKLCVGDWGSAILHDDSTPRHGFKRRTKTSSYPPDSRASSDASYVKSLFGESGPSEREESASYSPPEARFADLSLRWVHEDFSTNADVVVEGGRKRSHRRSDSVADDFDVDEDGSGESEKRELLDSEHVSLDSSSDHHSNDEDEDYELFDRSNSRLDASSADGRTTAGEGTRGNDKLDEDYHKQQPTKKATSSKQKASVTAKILAAESDAFFWRDYSYDMWSVGIVFLEIVLGQREPIYVRNNRKKLKMESWLSKRFPDSPQHISLALYYHALAELCLAPVVPLRRSSQFYPSGSVLTAHWEDALDAAREFEMSRSDTGNSKDRRTRQKMTPRGGIAEGLALVSVNHFERSLRPFTPALPWIKAQPTSNTGTGAVDVARCNSGDACSGDGCLPGGRKFGFSPGSAQNKERDSSLGACTDEQFKKVLEELDPSGNGLPHPAARDLLRRLLAFNQHDRLTAEEALSHFWFREV